QNLAPQLSLDNGHAKDTPSAAPSDSVQQETEPDCRERQHSEYFISHSPRHVQHFTQTHNGTHDSQARLLLFPARMSSQTCVNSFATLSKAKCVKTSLRPF